MQLSWNRWCTTSFAFASFGGGWLLLHWKVSYYIKSPVENLTFLFRCTNFNATVEDLCQHLHVSLKWQPMLLTTTYSICLVCSVLANTPLPAICWSFRQSLKRFGPIRSLQLQCSDAVWVYYYAARTNYNTAFVFPPVDHLWHGSDFLSMSRCRCNWILLGINIR